MRRNRRKAVLWERPPVADETGREYGKALQKYRRAGKERFVEFTGMQTARYRTAGQYFTAGLTAALTTPIVRAAWEIVFRVAGFGTDAKLLSVFGKRGGNLRLLCEFGYGCPSRGLAIHMVVPKDNDKSRNGAKAPSYGDNLPQLMMAGYER